MMQARDWIIGLIGVIFGGMGVLSLIGYLPFELSRNVLVWISAVASLILFYAAVIEITNSNVMGTVSIIVAGIAFVVSVLPVLNGFGWLGAWASFGWLGDLIYKILLVIEGAFLLVATFAMEL